MAQVMEPDRGQAEFLAELAEPVGEVLGADRPPVGVGEHRPSRPPARPGAGTGVAAALVGEPVLHQVGALLNGLFLKLADLGIAMGSGAPATKAVAELVLLDGTFATLPGVVTEGRRVTANIERVANLFITKTVWATLLAVAVGIMLLPYPSCPGT